LQSEADSDCQNRENANTQKNEQYRRALKYSVLGGGSLIYWRVLWSERGCVGHKKKHSKHIAHRADC
jgi:hypothetical protein